jgi:integrase
MTGAVALSRRALQRRGGDPVARRHLLGDRKRLKQEFRSAAGDRATRIRLQAELVAVRQQLQAVQATLGLVEPKSVRSRRSIRMPALVVRALKTHRVGQLKERLAAGTRWTESGLVFTTSIGTPIDARNVTRAFSAVVTAANLPSIRFHDLRHTAASLLLAQGVGPRTIMETLGHSQISLTMDHVRSYHADAAAGRRSTDERDLDPLTSRLTSAAGPCGYVVGYRGMRQNSGDCRRETIR